MLELHDTRGKQRKQLHQNPPKNAIINRYLIGMPPTILQKLTDTKIALVSDSRLFCQSWIYFAGFHQHINRWHKVYENRAAATNQHLQNLYDSGLKGQIAVVLCGPFTDNQCALVMERSVVRPSKVKEAFEWLKNNNIFFL